MSISSSSDSGFSSDQSECPLSSVSKYPPCGQDSVLWLFYRGKSLKPDPLRPNCGTFAQPPRKKVLMKAPDPSMRSMLIIPIPNWLKDMKDTEEHVLPLIPDSHLHALTRQASAMCRRYQNNSECHFGWRSCDTADTFPYEIHVARAVYTAHSVLLIATSPCMGTMQRFPMLSWATTHDSFFQSVWEDVLRESGFHLEFRPVWPVLYLQETSPSTHTTAPDVIISYRGVPLFIVEYVKADPSLLDKAIYPHLQHLMVSMQSSLAGRKELRPVFGLLIYEADVITVYGYIRDNKFYSKTTGKIDSPVFDLRKPFDVLALRMMISNSHSYAQKMSEAEIVSTKIRPIPCGSPGYNRAYLGPFAVLIDDQANRLHEADALQWMLSRRVRLTESIDSSNHGLSDSSISWVSLFVCCDIPTALDDDLILDCARCLTQRQNRALDQLKHDLLQLDNALYTHGLVSSSPPDTDRTALILDTQRAASFFASIQDTFGTEYIKEKPCPTRWSILLNSFLTAAWADIRAKGPNIVEFQCYPSWSMHRKVQINTIEDADPTPHQEITPDAAFIIKPDFVFGDAAFSKYTYEEQFEFSDELSVGADPSIYTGTTSHSQVPILIVEYVRDYSPQARKSHLVHLSMAMKSAMGLLHALVLPPIVLGLLVDGFRITVVCCSGSEAEDLVTELPEKYDFDLLKPIDVFRLRRCMRNVWKLAHEIERLDRAAHVQVEKSISSGAFPWWKASSDRHLGSTQTKDTIRGWCQDAASTM
ncbi:uncharacterized protein EV420DRAFT_1567720 [Desarmillaria tabescens]|uniref:Uncharacterized protein n=1 Tax=Armillaria tabescens TaxID=1929756 RepID=A0AA39JWC9_ARMTA|nr:uncharacterized protein EV420DRAFT_1567720 [Desarmillaria tabescens]KAK0447808.1 hypothetical protein EV420DRAFT_1567720 [Desarmillaria tabescens]